MKRIAFIAAVLTFTLAAFQNCTQAVNMNGEGQATQPSLGTGNAGGYGGKVFVLPAMPGECPANGKIKERLVLPDAGDAQLEMENCRVIAPVKIARTELTINSQTPEVLDYRGRAFADEVRFKPRLSCSYVTTTTTSAIDDTLLVGETPEGLVAIVHRLDKQGAGRRSLVTRNHALNSVPSTANPLLFSLTGTAVNLNLADMNSAAYAAGLNVQADISFQLTFFDMVSGVADPVVNANVPRTTCAVLR